MKKLNLLLLLCIYFVGCKCEEFPIRQSPIIFLDEITIPGQMFFFNDFDGNHLGCFTLNDSTDFIIPDSINKLEGYHLTYVYLLSNGPIGGLTPNLTTYTHVKVNSIKFNYNPSNSTQSKFVYFTLDVLEEDLEFVLTQRSSLSNTHTSVPSLSTSGGVTGSVNADAEFAYLFLKLKNENFIRFKKYSIPPDNNIPVSVLDMAFHSDAATEMTVSDSLISNVMLNGISNCPNIEMVPLSFKLAPNQYFRLDDNPLDFETFLSYYRHSNYGSIASSNPLPAYESYMMIRKGEILKNYAPLPIPYQLPYKDFEKFQLIIPKENCIAKTHWTFQPSGSNTLNWEIYGDYQGAFQGPNQLPSCFGSGSQITPQLINLTTYEGSEFSNYEEFLRRKINQDLPFYIRDLCDSFEEEFYEEKTMPLK